MRNLRQIIFISFSIVGLISCSHQKKSQAENKSDYSKTISFTGENKSFTSELRLPEKFDSPLPAVVIIHEWWGRTERMDEVAQRLTKEGYAALPVDLFGNGKTVETPAEAQKLATPFYKNPQKGVELLNQYVEKLSKDPHIDPKKIVVIGYCFGGTQALNLARSGADVAGVVSFHGTLDSSLKASSDMPALLVLNGGSDPMVPPAQVKAFKEEMKKANAKLEFITYPNATHAFTNPRATALGKKFNIPIAYDAKADQKSWQEFMDFMKEVKKGELP